MDMPPVCLVSDSGTSGGVLGGAETEGGVAVCLQSASRRGIRWVRGVREMPTLYLRDVPEDVYEGLKALATQERRSLSAEALTLLGEALAHLAFRRRGLVALERIGAWDSDYKPLPDGVDSSALLREGRA